MDELHAFAERHEAWAKTQLEYAEERARKTQDVIEYPRPTLLEEAERLLSYWERHGNNPEAVARWAVSDMLGILRFIVEESGE